MPPSLPGLGIALVLALVVVTFIFADSADRILKGWDFTDDDE